MPKATAKKSPKNPVVVNRKFLFNLANTIYDPKTRKFLRLCDGSLLGDTDPTNPNREMHCGLGELYFAMTGQEPVKVSEQQVIDMATRLSTITNTKEKTMEAAIAAIRNMNVPPSVKDSLMETVDNSEDEFGEAEQAFREALDEIPNVNDSYYGGNVNSYEVYRSRASKVAAQIRKAAKLLPA